MTDKKIQHTTLITRYLQNDTIQNPVYAVMYDEQLTNNFALSPVNVFDNRLKFVIKS